MIINNIEEFEQYVDSLFHCKRLAEKDKEEMENAIDLALKNIPKTQEKIKFICEYESVRDSWGRDESKIFFCMKRLSEEDNKDVILNFIKKDRFKYSERNQKLLIKMLDFLNEEEEKIKISSKLSCENLFDLMNAMMGFSKLEKFFRKKYYKNYYNIFNKALEYKGLK